MKTLHWCPRSRHHDLDVAVSRFVSDFLVTNMLSLSWISLLLLIHFLLSSDRYAWWAKRACPTTSLIVPFIFVFSWSSMFVDSSIVHRVTTLLYGFGTSATLFFWAGLPPAFDEAVYMVCLISLCLTSVHETCTTAPFVKLSSLLPEAASSSSKILHAPKKESDF